MAKYENGHIGHYIEGIAEHPVTKKILTVGTDGALNIWEPLNNKSSQRIPDIAGKNMTLTDLIITTNDMVVIAAFKEKSNLVFLPFVDLGKMDFLALDGGHNANITRLKNLSDAPMFLSLSGADIVGSMGTITKIVLWESVFPPRKITEFQDFGIVDSVASWSAKILFCGFLDGSLTTKNLRSGAKVKSLSNAHD